MLSVRSVTKKWIDVVTISNAFNEEYRKLHVNKCARINLKYNPSNISRKLMELSDRIGSVCKWLLRSLSSILWTIGGLLNSFRHPSLFYENGL